MNIKSLLLGTAAAFAVVSGAQAADAVVAAAPEPMEYVKVCDAFGAGYFYIPGTETCLQITGEIRYEVDYTSTAAASKWNTDGTLYRLVVNAKNNTELGTAYSFMRIEGLTNGTTNNTLYVGIDGGSIGFEAGHFDTYWTRFFDYGGFTYDGGRTNFMSNNYGAIYGTVGAYSYMASVDNLQATAGKTYGLNAAVKGTFGDIGAALGVAYDGAAHSAAIKGSISAKVDMFTLKLLGVYADKANNAYAQNFKGFTLIAAAKADLTSNLFVAIDYSYSFTPKTSYIVGDLGVHIANGFDFLGEGTYDSGTKAKGAFFRLSRTF